MTSSCPYCKLPLKAGDPVIHVRIGHVTDDRKLRTDDGPHNLHVGCWSSAVGAVEKLLREEGK